MNDEMSPRMWWRSNGHLRDAWSDVCVRCGQGLGPIGKNPVPCPSDGTVLDLRLYLAVHKPIGISPFGEIWSRSPEIQGET